MGTDPIPVLAVLAGAEAASVRRWLDADPSWASVEDVASVPPWLVIADVAAVHAGLATPPHVLLVSPGDDPADAAAAAVSAAAETVVRWPDDRDRLRDLTPVPPDVAAAPVVTVGGAAGGVGTTTVAAGLAGLSAWGGTRTLLVARGPTPGWDGPPLAADALTGPRTWVAARPAPGVADLRVVRVAGPPTDAAVPGAGLVVHDRGVGDEVDVLVLRRDTAGCSALRRTTAGVAVVVDLGAASTAALRAAATDLPLVVIPWSVRIARAGLADRVPAGLPGSVLGRLRTVLDPVSTARATTVSHPARRSP